ncbi:hypothetical protein [Amycolatopsis rubida]|uniref:Uncharacterized protein n=1 Tax=Amycolatopsis rubida TaxID=112413 RepID=A0A1I5X7S4_9PSEU|nr:hypothetical protein [Amycolatopsis rubida]SFQ28020.1 hypothetical protein SAMN05421854_11084 [Amycolatopsis rubida]
MGKLTLRDTPYGEVLRMTIEVPREDVLRSVVAGCSTRRIVPGKEHRQPPLRYADVIVMIKDPMAKATWEDRHPILQRLDREGPDGDGPASRLRRWVETEMVRLGIFPAAEASVS